MIVQVTIYVDISIHQDSAILNLQWCKEYFEMGVLNEKRCNNNCNFDWGNNNYDMKLFSLKDISIANTNTNTNRNTNTKSSYYYYVNSPNPSSSLCPYKVFVFLKKFHPNISF